MKASKVIYLNGNLEDEYLLNACAEEGYKLVTVVSILGTPIAYLWKEAAVAPPKQGEVKNGSEAHQNGSGKNARRENQRPS